MKKKIFTSKNLVKVLTVMAVLIYCMVPVCCNGLWDSGAAASSFAENVINLYKKWAWIVGFIAAIGWYVLPGDDKKKGVCRATTIGVCVLYVVAVIGGNDGSYFTQTLDTVAGWFSGGGN